MPDSHNKTNDTIKETNDTAKPSGFAVGATFTLDDLTNASAPELPSVSETTEGFMEDAQENVHSYGPKQQQETTDPAQQYRGQLSSKGDKYIPGVHQFPPKETKGGQWAKIRGRKRNGEVSGEYIAAEKVAADYRAHAENLAMIYGDGHKPIYGMEGGRVVPGEVSQLANALERYLIEKGDVQVSPLITVLLNMTAYTRGVISRPENKETNRKIVSFFKRAFTPIFAPIKRWLTRGKENAQADTRDNEQRKEQPSETTGA